MQAVWPAFRSDHMPAPEKGAAAVARAADANTWSPACCSVRSRASGDETRPATPPAKRPLVNGRSVLLERLANSANRVLFITTLYAIAAGSELAMPVE